MHSKACDMRSVWGGITDDWEQGTRDIVISCSGPTNIRWTLTRTKMVIFMIGLYREGVADFVLLEYGPRCGVCLCGVWFNVQHKTSNTVATLGGKSVADATTVSHKSSLEKTEESCCSTSRHKITLPTVSDWFHSAAVAAQLLKWKLWLMIWAKLCFLSSKLSRVWDEH